MSERDRAYYAANRDKVIAKVMRQQAERWDIVAAAKDKPCMDCGVRYDPWVMDLDHRDPTTKINDLRTLITHCVKMSTILAEIEKCDVVCANCHRQRTHARKLSPIPRVRSA